MSYYNVQDRIYNELAFELRYFILFDLQLAFLQFLLSFQKSSQYQFSSLIFTMFFYAVFCSTNVLLRLMYICKHNYIYFSLCIFLKYNFLHVSVVAILLIVLFGKAVHPHRDNSGKYSYTIFLHVSKKINYCYPKKGKHIC